MEKQTSKINFILVDDDPINIVLCTNILKLKIPEAEVISFTEPIIGLEHLKNNYNLPHPAKAILYLDINMPVMSGWEFMEVFEKLDALVKEQIIVCILSSSVDYRDLEKAKANKNISDYFVKPLRKENIISSLNYFRRINSNQE